MDNKKHAKVKLQTIELFPAYWSVDIWVCNNIKHLSHCFEQRYGADNMYYFDNFQHDQVTLVNSTNKSELKGSRRIVMNVSCMHLGTILHELIHVCWYLSKYSGLKLNFESQEWHACLMERIYEKAKNKKLYTIYKMKS